jgi:hypothetical protein
MPVLGIIASSNWGSAFGGSYDSIASVTASAGATTITFSSIPSSYTHLQIRGFTNTSGTGSYSKIYFNGDTTTANYRSHSLRGDGATASAADYTGYGGVLGFVQAGMGNSTSWASSVLDILDYGNTNKNKTTRLLEGVDFNGSGSVEFYSGLWMSTAAITSVTLAVSGQTYSAGSTFALYGIKAA